MREYASKRWDLRDESGSVAVWFVLLMPVMLALMGFVFDLGWAAVGRNYLQVAADSAALAGVLEVDLESLGRGQCILFVSQARSVATTYAGYNLSSAFRPEHAVSCTSIVRVYQPGDPGQHGLHLSAGSPTVCVSLEMPVRLPVTGFTRVLRAHADASLMSKPK